MKVKLTSNEASEAQKRIATRVCGLRPDEAEWVWTDMHDAADDEPGRLVREVAGQGAELRTDLMIAAGNADTAAKTDPAWEGVGAGLRERIAAYDSAMASALANPIARAFLEGE